MGDVTGSPTGGHRMGQTPRSVGQTALSWFTQRGIRNYWLKSGSLIVAISAALTLVLVGIVIFELGSIVDAVFHSLFPSSVSGSSPQSGSARDVLQGGLQEVLFVWTFLFFSSHLAPYEVSVTGGVTIAITGIGSLTIAVITAVMSFMLGRRLEQRSPWIDSNGVAACAPRSSPYQCWLPRYSSSALDRATFRCQYS